MTKHTQEMVTDAKNLIKYGNGPQSVDAKMLNYWQGKKGLEACKSAIEQAYLELAAPELLEALKKLSGPYSDDPGGHNTAMKMARAAIKKAEGDQ